MESAGITPVRNGVNMSRHGGPLVINEPRSGDGVGGVTLTAILPWDVAGRGNYSWF